MKVSILSLVFAVISVAKSDSYDDNVVFTVHVSGRWDLVFILLSSEGLLDGNFIVRLSFGKAILI